MVNVVVRGSGNARLQRVCAGGATQPKVRTLFAKSYFAESQIVTLPHLIA
jgi:hypothetical protein